MAGAGYKTWVDGDILTAADVNTYLMQQAVMRFADAAARTSAIAAPSEGMVTYLVDTDRIEYYDGAAWQPILDQDVIEAKGDLIVGTADDAVARLAVGTNKSILVADSGQTTGVKWDSTLNVDSANARVGIGTATPAHPLHVTGSDNRPIRAESTVTGSYIDLQDATTTDEGYVAVGAVGDELKLIAGGSTRLTIATGGVITSPATYSNTTASAANMVVDSGGIFYRSTSSRKYKTDIETLDDEYADIVFRLRPVWYRSTTGNDPETWSYYGFIAEEVAEIDPRLVNFGPSADCLCAEDESGHVEHDLSCLTEPEGVQYDRLVPHLINVVQRQQTQINALEARLAALEGSATSNPSP